MKNAIRYMLVVIVIVFCASTVKATPFLYDWAFNVDGVPYENCWGDTMPTDGALDSEGLGTLTWSTSDAGTHSFIAFFNHDIDDWINTWFNEYGTAVNTPVVTQSWEIDEPGYLFGNIYNNVLAGSLDNTNAVPQGSEDDVSWAIGWDFTVADGETALISLILGYDIPASGFYLAQTDPDSDYSIYFSSTLSIDGGDIPAPVPEPATMLLLGTGLVGLVSFRKRIMK